MVTAQAALLIDALSGIFTSGAGVMRNQ